MWFFEKKRNERLLQTEVAGLRFRNPVGTDHLSRRIHAGFISLNPPQEGILDWVRQIEAYRGKSVLAVNLHADIVRSFSLVYDFADLLILDPDSDNGIDSPDFSDTTALLEEIVSLRLCYEQYTPVFLRLSHAAAPDELAPLLGQCRLFGIDGIVAASVSQVKQVLELTQARVPVMGMAETPESAAEILAAGAALVETHFRGFQMNLFLQQLEKQTIA